MIGAALLAAAGGVLCFLGFAGFGIWPLALVCLTPLWQALENVCAPGAGSEAGGTRRTAPGWLAKAGGLGFVFGAVAYAGGFHWMWRLVDVFLGGDVFLGALLWIGDSSWFALRFALYAAAYALLRRRDARPAVAGVAPLVAVEWLHPLLFPVYLGHAFAAQATVVQIADLGGPLLLTALLALMNAAAFETWLWLRRRRPTPVATWAAAALAIGLTCGYAWRRTPQIEAAIAAAPTLRVGVVQGNLGLFEKGSSPRADHERYLAQTRELLAAGALDLVVWPETVYTRGLRRPLPISGRLVREDLEVPLLFGAASVSGDTGTRLKYNSALLVGADGVIRQAYDKNLLIPFTEYVPFERLARPLLESSSMVSEFSAARETPALMLGPWRLSTPICSEAIQPAFVRRMVRDAEPHVLVTLANDAWFGDSQEPELHLAMARMRAVEHRRYLVRATNSGISAIVDPLGRVVTRSGVLTRATLRGDVRPLTGATTYATFGDWPGWLAVLVTLWAAAGPRSKVRVPR